MIGLMPVAVTKQGRWSIVVRRIDIWQNLGSLEFKRKLQENCALNLIQMFLVLKDCSLLGIFLLLPMMQEFSVKTCMKKNPGRFSNWIILLPERKPVISFYTN